jgi:hypothetical protein
MEQKRTEFYNCFHTAEDLGQSLRKKSNTTTTECRVKAVQALDGNMDFPSHLHYNYEYYVNMTLSTYPQKEVFVVRTEHLWDDLSELDMMVGGSGPLSRAGSKYDHGSSVYKVRSKLSNQGKQLLCYGLRKEIQIYKDLIQRAVNLDDSEKKDAIDAVDKDCGDMNATAILIEGAERRQNREIEK